MAISLGGLASGVDSSSIIEQLMQIDAQSKARLQLRQNVLEARQQALSDVKSRLSNLLTAAKDLGTGTAWADVQTLDVSDATKLSAKLLSGAAPGGHEINVTGLARSEQRSYAYTGGSASTLSLTTSAGTTNVSLAAEDDGKAVADKINATAGAPVYAVWVKDPNGVAANDRLVLTRKDTGEFLQGDLTVSGGAGLGSEAYTAGADAAYTVDGGIVQNSRSNVLTAAVPGLQLTLKATGTSAVTVGAPGPDPEAVKAKVKAFVSQYNSTVDFIRSKVTEKKVANATTTGDASKGVLSGDTQLNGVLSASGLPSAARRTPGAGAVPYRVRDRGRHGHARRPRDARHAGPGVRLHPDRPGDAGARVRLGRAAARPRARPGGDRAAQGGRDDAHAAHPRAASPRLSRRPRRSPRG